MKSTQACHEVSRQRLRQIAAEAGRLVATLGQGPVAGWPSAAPVGPQGVVAGALSWTGDGDEPPESTIWDIF